MSLRVALYRSRVRVAASSTLVLIAALALPPTSNATPPLSQTGQWLASDSLGVIGTHVTVMRDSTTNRAFIFLFGGSGYAQRMKVWKFTPEDAVVHLPAITSTDSLSVLLPVRHPNDLAADLFCGSHTTLADGRMLLSGGMWAPPGPCEQVYAFNRSWSGDSATSPWSHFAPMALDRWYATTTALPDGKVMAWSGTNHTEMLTFGGTVAGAPPDSILHPLNIGAWYGWGDITAPGAPSSGPDKDDLTNGAVPRGREGGALVGSRDGRVVLVGGRVAGAGGSWSYPTEIWSILATATKNESTHVWHKCEVLGDTTLGGATPVGRRDFAACWGGIEDDAGTQYTVIDPATRKSDGFLYFFVQGGIDSTGHVLGDLWRGCYYSDGLTEHYKLRWERLLPDSARTARYGHTMVYDPGPVAGRLTTPPIPDYAKLLVFGGKSDATTLADNGVWAYGLGAQVAGNWWQVFPDSSASGTPPRREGHVAVEQPNQLSGERRMFVFGGQTAGGTVVDDSVWVLGRPDVAITDTAAYYWKRIATYNALPGRAHAAGVYHDDSEALIIYGGDTNGDSLSGGLTNEVWKLPLNELTPTYGHWVQPTFRDTAQHPVPPARARLAMYSNPSEFGARHVELFDPNGNSGAGDDCDALPGTWATVTRQDSTSARAIDDYPFMFQLPDGRLFYAGPEPYDSDNPYKRFFNRATANWEDSSTVTNRDSIVFGSAAMFRPGQIIRAGTHGEGASVENPTDSTMTISIAAGMTPAWVPYPTGAPGKPSMIPRTNLNLTLLPTGDVLASGGLATKTDLNSAVKEPQIWSVATGTWNSANFTPMNPDPEIRNYHAAAALLPDGRVMTSGGEENRGVFPPDRWTVSVFEPPYLFDGNARAPRPRILDGPEVMTYGHSTFTYTLTDSTRIHTIKSMALMRPSSVTHGFDQNQRYVPLTFTAADTPARLLVNSPQDSLYAPPGEYMLFVVDSVSSGAPRVPSIAKWVLVRRQASDDDSLDVWPPRGGSYLNLTDVSPCNTNADLYVAWTAPAEDDVLAASGRAAAYNLRYTLNTNSGADFNTWTAVATGAPGLVGASETAILSGLSTATWYRFAVKALGDNRDTSVVSNILVTKPRYCDNGGSGGSGGGGGFSARRAGAYSLMGTAPAVRENSLLPGVPLGTLATDALPLGGEPNLVGSLRTAYVREGDTRGMTVDRVRLLAVDHADSTEAVSAPDGSVLVGARRTAASVTDHLGRDLTVAATGTGPEPLYADSGEVLEVALPAAGQSAQALLIETLDGTRGPGGIGVTALANDGTWREVGALHPRHGWSTSALALPATARVRLAFAAAHALRFAGVLANAATAVPQSAPLRSATSTRSGPATGSVAATDDSTVVMAAGDTLSLSFDDLPAPASGARTWFLEVTGTPVAREAASALAARVEGADARPAVFALHQSLPNPARVGAVIPFDLPVRESVKLEIYDAQGRRVWKLTAPYEAGRYRVEWDLRTQQGARVTPGVYAYRLIAGPFRDERKLVVLP